MSAKSLRVLHSKCAHKPNCSVLASTNMFGDPCPGTHKYLEAHYQCVSAAQTSTTTTRPSPPWLITSQPSVWSTSTVRVPTTTRINVHHESGGGGGTITMVGDTANNSSGGGAKQYSAPSSATTSQVNSKSVVGIKFKPLTIGGGGTATPTTTAAPSNGGGGGGASAVAQPAVAEQTPAVPSASINLHASNQSANGGGGSNAAADTSTSMSVTLIGDIGGLSSSSDQQSNDISGKYPSVSVYHPTTSTHYLPLFWYKTRTHTHTHR